MFNGYGFLCDDSHILVIFMNRLGVRCLQGGMASPSNWMVSWECRKMKTARREGGRGAGVARGRVNLSRNPDIYHNPVVSILVSNGWKVIVRLKGYLV